MQTGCGEAVGELTPRGYESNQTWNQNSECQWISDRNSDVSEPASKNRCSEETEALAEAEDLVSSWSDADRLNMQLNVAEKGLKLQCAGRGGKPTTMQSLAQDVLKISRGGLQRRGHGEGGFLDKLQAIADKGQTQAEDLQFKYNNLWQGNIDPIFVDGFMKYLTKARFPH